MKLFIFFALTLSLVEGFFTTGQSSGAWGVPGMPGSKPTRPKRPMKPSKPSKVTKPKIKCSMTRKCKKDKTCNKAFAASCSVKALESQFKVYNAIMAKKVNRDQCAELVEEKLKAMRESMKKMREEASVDRPFRRPERNGTEEEDRESRWEEREKRREEKLEERFDLLVNYIVNSTIDEN